MTKVKIFRVTSLSFLLSAIFFYKVNVNFNEYIFIASAFLVFFALSYRIFTKNRNLAAIYTSITIPNILTFLTFKFFDDYRPVWIWDRIDILFSIYALFLVLILGYVLKEKKEKETEIDNYFPHRERELKKLEFLLKETNIIGIDASWGDGKSFLMQLFAQKQGNETNTHIINISVLASTIETIESYIISEISNFLEENYIFSYSSPKIKKFFLQPLLKNWSFCFDEKNSYSELFSSLVKDVKNLGKTIILSFEDLERIRDDKIILKVFNISDKINYECNKIGCNCIKIIYQYDKKELTSLLKIEQKPNYLEKYIPYEIKLSPIPFIDSVKIFIEKLHCQNITDKDFIPFSESTVLLGYYNPFYKATPITRLHCLCLQSYNLRKTKTFLNEIDSLLNDKYCKENKNIVITFCIIKYFYPSFYSQIKFGQSIQESVIITPEGTTGLNSIDFFQRSRKEIDSIYENDKKKSTKLENKKNTNEDSFKKNTQIYNQAEETFQKIRNNPFNINNLKKSDLDKLVILKLLGYNIEQPPQQTQPFEQIEKNDAIDRLLWRLKYAGLSGYTKNNELLLELLFLIDSTDNHEQKNEKYNKLLLKIKQQIKSQHLPYSEDHFIFILMLIYENDSTKWNNLIDFYIQHRANKFIDEDIFPIYKTFKISTKKILLHALETFSSLEIKNTVSDHFHYLEFLQKYLESIKTFGFFSQQNIQSDCFCSYIYIHKEKLSEYELLTSLSNIKKEVETIHSQNLNIQAIANECKIIKQFIDKNIEFINAPQNPENEEADKQTNENDEKEKFEKYLASTTKEELDKLIEESYSKNELSLGEIKEIREKFEKKIESLKSKIKRTRISSRVRPKKE